MAVTLTPTAPAEAAAYDRWFDSRWERYAFGVERTAHFLTRRTLLALGRRHGHTSLVGALFAPGAAPETELVGRTLEAIGKRLVPALGAFQVLVIQKETL
jgi:hypothetical protein